MGGWIVVFVALLAAGLLLLRQADRRRRHIGLPQGHVIYADTGAWDCVERPLFSRRYRITGKPDYLLDDDDEIIPVEVKSSGTPSQPYPSHVLQLAAYCLLVEEAYDVRPSHGIIRYPDQTFAVHFTSHLEAWLLSMLDEMRRDARADDVPRSHDNPAQCAACGYRPLCDQSLV